MLQDAQNKGRGKLHFFPNTVVKDLEISQNGKIINSAIAIQHQPGKMHHIILLLTIIDH